MPRRHNVATMVNEPYLHSADDGPIARNWSAIWLKCSKLSRWCQSRLFHVLYSMSLSFYCFAFFAGWEIARWLLNDFGESESFGGLLAQVSCQSVQRNTISLTCCTEHKQRKGCPSGSLTGVLVSPPEFHLFQRNLHQASLFSCQS